MMQWRVAARHLAALGGAVLLGLGTAEPANAGANANANANANARAASLVTDAEAAASAKAFAEHPDGPGPNAGRHQYYSDNTNAPVLDVVAPKVGLPARPPFDVRVIVRPRAGLGIDKSSIRIRYGFFRVDITSRMLALGQWQGNEFVIRQAKAPTGTHLFYVSVADTAHHEASVSLKVIVQ